MANKMTIREGFEKARALYEQMGDAEMVEFFDTRIAQTIKKNSAERKPTPKQLENDNFKADILAWMDANTLYTCAEIHDGVPSIVAAGISPNRVSALMTQLKDVGAVVATTEKRKNYYQLSA